MAVIQMHKRESTNSDAVITLVQRPTSYYIIFPTNYRPIGVVVNHAINNSSKNASLNQGHTELVAVATCGLMRCYRSFELAITKKPNNMCLCA